jgi:tetratricopeptide (TPR) repeat protein
LVADPQGVAEDFASRAHDALKRRDLTAAVRLLREGLAMLLSGPAEQSWSYSMRAAEALGAFAEPAGRAEAVAAAVEFYRNALASAPREISPLAWATTQANLGSTLWAFGEQEHQSKWLEDAATAFQQALKELTRADAPLAWAATQTNLAAALWALGELEVGTIRLEEALLAFRTALAEITRDRLPNAWLRIRVNIGAVLVALAQREDGTARLEEAITVWNDCLPVAETAQEVNLVRTMETSIKIATAEIIRRSRTNLFASDGKSCVGSTDDDAS